MNYPSAEFDDAVSACCHGTATEEQFNLLAELLRTNEAARDTWLLSVELHARLAADHGLLATKHPAENHASAVVPRPNSILFRRFLVGAVAAGLLLVVGLASWRSARRAAIDFDPPGVAVEVLDTRGIVSDAWRKGGRIRLRELHLASGTLEVRLLQSGVRLRLAGPAEVTFLDEMRLHVARGQLTADVGEHGKGFSIETAQARVVDLGTMFGVDVSEHKTTDVVVFRGSVEMFQDRRRQIPSTLLEGEAVRVGAGQEPARIPNIITRASESLWSTTAPTPDECVIESVRDNLRSPETRIFYEIIPNGLAEGVEAYVGPRHIWKGRTAMGLPSYLRGADFVRTFMSDHRKQDLTITVKLSKPAILYVLFECRPQQWKWRQAGNVEEVPKWLSQGFHKTGDAVGLDDAAQLGPGETMSAQPGQGHLVTFDVWELKVDEPGEVTLGPPTGSDGWVNWMYGIAAKPL